MSRLLIDLLTRSLSHSLTSYFCLSHSLAIALPLKRSPSLTLFLPLTRCLSPSRFISLSCKLMSLSLTLALVQMRVLASQVQAQRNGQRRVLISSDYLPSCMHAVTATCAPPRRHSLQPSRSIREASVELEPSTY